MAAPFARAPGYLDQENYLDFRERSAMAVYDSSIKSLYGSEEDAYDLQADGLTLFLNKLDERAREFGWDKNVLILENDPNNIGGPGTYYLDTPGAFTLEHIQTIEIYYNAEQSRTSQNSFMLSKALIASLTPDAVNRVTQTGRAAGIGADQVGMHGIAVAAAIVHDDGYRASGRGRIVRNVFKCHVDRVFNFFN